MTYCDAIEIVKELAIKFRRYEYFYRWINKVNEKEYKYWADALETVLKEMKMMELDEAIFIVKKIIFEQKRSEKDWNNIGYTEMVKRKKRDVDALETVLKEVEKNGIN